MSQDYTPGDFLIFQIESAFGLIRLLDIESSGGDRIWHVSAYSEMFLDPDTAEEAINSPTNLTVSHDHLALTTRAFESTQTARMLNVPLVESDLEGLNKWLSSDSKEVSDRSVRLLLGMR